LKMGSWQAAPVGVTGRPLGLAGQVRCGVALKMGSWQAAPVGVTGCAGREGAESKPFLGGRSRTASENTSAGFP
jgi:hypothetical protein